MTPPIVSVARIMIPYTQTGMMHKVHYYVKSDNPGSHSSTLQKTLGGTASFADAAQALAAAISNILDAGTTPGTAELQFRTLGMWTTYDTVALTFPNSGGSVRLTSQSTMVLRTRSGYKVRSVVLECNQDSPFHTIAPTGGTNAQDAYVKEFTSAFTLTAAPYEMIRDRLEQGLTTTPFVGLTVSLNRKLRRARGFV